MSRALLTDWEIPKSFAICSAFSAACGFEAACGGSDTWASAGGTLVPSAITEIISNILKWQPESCCLRLTPNLLNSCFFTADLLPLFGRFGQVHPRSKGAQ